MLTSQDSPHRARPLDRVGDRTVPELPTRGRPRDPKLDERILTAALDELGERGFARMSIESVARRAGVPKPTVYRRWSSKADLATAAIHQLQSSEPVARGRTTPERLRSILSSFRRNLLRPNGMAMIGTLLVEEQHHPELMRLFRERIVDPRRQRLRRELERGVDRGEVAGSADLEAVVNLLVGSFYAIYLSGTAPPRTWPGRVVGTVWAGIRSSD